MALEASRVVQEVAQEGVGQAWEALASELEEQAEVVAAAVAGMLERLPTMLSQHGPLPCFAAVLYLQPLSHHHRHHLPLQNTPLSLCLPQEFPGLKRNNAGLIFKTDSGTLKDHRPTLEKNDLKAQEKYSIRN